MFAILIWAYDFDVFLLNEEENLNKLEKNMAAQKTYFNPKNHIFFEFLQKL